LLYLVDSLQKFDGLADRTTQQDVVLPEVYVVESEAPSFGLVSEVTTDVLEWVGLEGLSMTLVVRTGLGFGVQARHCVEAVLEE
jgi:hypothetical protein